MYYTDCLHNVKKEYQEGQVPITDDSIPLHKFCAKLEYLLQIDTKGKMEWMYEARSLKDNWRRSSAC